MSCFDEFFPPPRRCPGPLLPQAHRLRQVPPHPSLPELSTPIWVQRDATEYGVANELVDLGVPREDIVLGFQAPFNRPYTDFVVA
ncbi:MAG: hypothetical protein D6722_10035 [Bacteroidetes bacterium]|nr:MAG: hypothetical protein D6722_10035 [Bacteroidota bacterium]